MIVVIVGDERVVERFCSLGDVMGDGLAGTGGGGFGNGAGVNEEGGSIRELDKGRVAAAGVDVVDIERSRRPRGEGSAGGGEGEPEGEEQKPAHAD